jgi:hypothetical protein
MAEDKPFWELHGKSGFEEFWEKRVMGGGTRPARKNPTDLPQSAAPTLRERRLRSCR